MMYEEFCKGIGEEISYHAYERVEAVYMEYDRFSDKKKLYRFYKKHGMEGINALHQKIMGRKRSEQIVKSACYFHEAQSFGQSIKDANIELDSAFHNIAIRLCPFFVGQTITYLLPDSTSGLSSVQAKILKILPIYELLFSAQKWAINPLGSVKEPELFHSDYPLYTLALGYNEKQIELSPNEIVKVEAANGKKTFRAKDLMTHGFGKQYNTARSLMLACEKASKNLKNYHNEYKMAVRELQDHACPFREGSTLHVDNDSKVLFTIAKISLCYQPGEEFVEKVDIGGRLFEVSGYYINEDRKRPNKTDTHALSGEILDCIEEANGFRSILFSDIMGANGVNSPKYNEII